MNYFILKVYSLLFSSPVGLIVHVCSGSVAVSPTGISSSETAKFQLGKDS